MNRQKCIDMWQWIVDHPGSSKEDWYKAHPDLIKEIIEHNGCYACKEDYEITGGDDCDNCPVNWCGDGWGEGDCLDIDSPFTDWDDANRVLSVIKETWYEV